MDVILRFAGVLLLSSTLLACDSTTAGEHMARAEDRLDEGEIRTAVIELKNALKKAPDNADARVMLGEAHARLGDDASALKEFERALDLGRDDDQVRGGVFRAKLRLGRHQEVIGALEETGALSPPFAVILGDAYLASGDVERARSLYEQAPSLSGANLGLGRIAWQHGDHERASTYLGRAVEIDPENTRAWLRRGEFELSRRNFEEAESAFASAADLPAGRVLGRAGLARVAVVRQDLETAAERVRELLSVAPDFPMAHYLDGLVRFEQQDLEGAESAIRQVQQVAPDHPPSLYLMGAIKYRQGHLAQAEDHLERYLAHDAGNQSVVKLLASARFDQGAYERAAEALEPVVETTRDPQILAMYGAAQMRLNHAGRAIPALERAVDLAPDAAPFRNQLALGLLAAGDRDRAEAELESAVAVDGEQFQSDYLLALLHLREQNREAAAEAVDSLIDKNPDSPIGYNLRGAVALARQDLDAARAAFAEAQAKDPEFFPAVQNLARLAERAGELERATGHYRDYLERHGDDENALVALADLALRREEPGDAAEYLERAVTSNPQAVRPRLGLARLHLARGRVDAADALVDEALELAPTMPDLLLLRGRIALRQGDTRTAERAARELQARADDGSNPALHASLGMLQTRIGQFTLARSNLERALELSDDPLPGAERALARLDLRDGNVAAASERVDALLEADPDAPETRLLHADVLLASGRRDEAAGILTGLAEQGVRESVMRLATVSLEDGEIGAAVSRLESWLEQRPDDLGAELLLADALMRQDQDQALVRYEGLVESGNPVVLNNLAWLYMERGDPRAEEMARQAADAAPDNPDILDTLGWILLQQSERPNEALRLLRRSAQLDPDNPSVQYHLGIALRETGDVRSAREALARAAKAEDHPEAKDARAALARLTES